MTKLFITLLVCFFNSCDGKTEIEQNPIIFVNKSGNELFIVQQTTIQPSVQINQTDSCINTIGVKPIASHMNICQKK